MNCPQCGQRNPSNAKHCLHCNTRFEEIERQGLFESAGDPESSGNGMIIGFSAVVVLIIGGSMALFGFDTYDSKCVRSETAAAEFEAAPDWERDASAERRKRDRDERRHRERTGRRMSSSDHGFLQCYRKKTGHVDGVME